jgi:hypothetical protein
LGCVKVQFAEHPLAERGAVVVALLNEEIIGLTADALVVAVADRVVAGACGCAGTVVVIVTDVTLVSDLYRSSSTTTNLLVHFGRLPIALPVATK